ncbi:putative immunity protein [uncultured Leifsonia sp.]|uniref:putative immunity protein n=1 Tax=uncultured Leifsonia sp. TaxID=340359 RepID=UPI0025D5CC5A|nr:hypothetical protein [uncultured Leifsonia sp.]
MISPQTLDDADRRAAAAWAADCAERVLPLFEAEAPDDPRAREAIGRARAYARGELTAAVAHVGAHALGAAAYAARAASLAVPGDPHVLDDEVNWQLERMSPDVRAALGRIPRLGEDRSGPLGPGLLASGVLATVIRTLQEAVGRS